MKNIYFLLAAVVLISVASCTKEYPVPVFTPEANTWVVNQDTIGPATFKYYDTANVIYGGITGKASVRINFRFKPKTDGSYVFREKADEIDEISITVIDSVNKITWMSTDNDGRPLKKEQHAEVKVNGSNVGVAFNDMFLKRTDNVDMAKTSVNISY